MAQIDGQARPPLDWNRYQDSRIWLACRHADLSAIGKGLYEVRTNLPGNRTARVLFCVRREMILLHGFLKKSQQMPKMDLDLALERKRKLEAGS